MNGLPMWIVRTLHCLLDVPMPQLIELHLGRQTRKHSRSYAKRFKATPNGRYRFATWQGFTRGPAITRVRSTSISKPYSSILGGQWPRSNSERLRSTTSGQPRQKSHIGARPKLIPLCPHLGQSWDPFMRLKRKKPKPSAPTNVPCNWPKCERLPLLQPMTSNGASPV